MVCFLRIRRRQKKKAVTEPAMIKAREVIPIPMPDFSAVERLFEVDAPELDGRTEEPEVGAFVAVVVCAGEADVAEDTVVDLANEMVSPTALGKLAIPARLEGHIIKPLVVPEHEHCPGIPSAVLVVAPGQPLQTTEPLASAESLHCTRPRIC